MNKKQAIATSCIALLIAAASFINVRVSGTTADDHKHSASSPNTPAEHVAYEFLFRRVILFRQRASAAGQPLAPDFTLKREAGLSDDQVRMLADIAATCLEEVDALDQRARVVINEFRSRFPGRVVPRNADISPPRELTVMQQQRDAAFLRGRARLQQVFGEQEFNRFNRFMQERYGTNR